MSFVTMIVWNSKLDTSHLIWGEVIYIFTISYQKSLKTPEGQFESINRSRLINTDQKKMDKRTNSDLQNMQIMLKIE